MRGRGRIGALVAIVLVTGLAVATIGLARRARHASPLAELAVAVGPASSFDARLSGGFAPRAERDVRRAADAGTSTVHLPPDARIAIAKIEKRASADRTPEMLGALGAAYLVEGEVDLAIA